MTKSRHSGIDLLRILAAFGVVLIHVTAPFVTYNKGLLNSDFWAGNVFNALGRFSVPIFVIVSGFFILKPIDSLREFYHKRFARILWPFVCWSVFFLLWAFFFDRTPLSKIVDNLLWGKPYFHLWFLGMLMGLYAVTPLLGDLLKRVGIRRFAFVAIGAFLLAMSIDAWDTYVKSRPWIGLWWISYVGYFMVGACMRDYKGAFNGRTLLVSTIAICYLSIVLFTGWLFANGCFVWYFYSYLSITSIVGAVAFVNLFRGINVPVKRWMGRLSDLTFGIYLVHVVPLGIIKRYWSLCFVENPFVNILLVACAVFVSSALIVFLMSKVPMVKRLML